MSSASRAYQQRADVKVAERRVDGLEEEIELLEAELKEEIAEVGKEFDPVQLKLETIQVKPYKKDIDVKEVSLIWLPFDERDEKVW